MRLQIDEDLAIVLPTEDGGTRRLVRVTPVFLTRSGQSTEEVCRDFADMVADNNRVSHMVFRGPERRAITTAPINGSDGLETTGFHHLAEGMTHVADGTTRPEDVAPSWAADLVRRDDRPMGGFGDVPMPGRSYGAALNLSADDNPRRDAMSDVARRVGVNEYAWADVGEGYLIQSIQEAGEDGHGTLTPNHAKNGPATPTTATTTRPSSSPARTAPTRSPWRTGPGTGSGSRSSRRTCGATRWTSCGRPWSSCGRRSCGRGRPETSRRPRGCAATWPSRERWPGPSRPRRRCVRRPGIPEHASAEQSYQWAVRAAGPHGGARVRHPGQAAVGRADARPAPRETRTTPRRNWRTPAPRTSPTPHRRGGPRPPGAAGDRAVRPGAVEPRETALPTVRRLAAVMAKTALWNSEQGLPLPQATVIGRGNARRLVRDTGKLRAQNLADLLRAEIAAELARRQDGLPGPRLSADQFVIKPISSRTRLHDDEERGREATIVVDDQRGGPRQVATRGVRNPALDSAGSLFAANGNESDPTAADTEPSLPEDVTPPTGIVRPDSP
ncbi:hypothetical protein NKH77_28685 [Streptomyces sp. M19]